jgi:DNA-binding IclR family transcriptional regulator
VTTEGDTSPATSLDAGLTVLAQFESKRVALAPEDVERLTGIRSATAARCLTTLSGLGYLASGPDGRYRLAGRPVDISVRRGRHGGTTGAAA